MKVFKFLLRCFFIGVIALVTLEAAARLDDLIRYRANPLEYFGSKNLRWVDDRGITFNRPGGSFQKWRNDELGFRQHPLSAEAAQQPETWVCVGTSETYGLYESPGNEWPSQLARLTAPAGVGIQNAAVVGMSPFGYRAYLEHYVLPHDPELVILVINPFSFVAGFDSDREASPEDLADDRRIASMRRLSSPRPRELSRFLGKARIAITDQLPRHMIKERRLRKVRAQVAADLARSGHQGELLDGPGPEMLPAYRDHLARLVAFLEGRGVRAALCTYGNSLNLAGGDFAREVALDRRKWMAEYSEKGMVEISRSFAAATREFCREQQIPLLDFEKVLTKDQTVFADSVHLTDHGAELAARTAWQALGPGNQGARP